MTRFYWLAAAFVAAAAVAQPAKDVFADIGVQIQGSLKGLTALEAEEKKLRTSDDAQTFASTAEQKQRAQLQKDIEALQSVAEGADRMRADIIRSGCPEHGGVADIALANRCNPLVETHKLLVERLTERANKLKAQRDVVDRLRADINATVLQNFEKRKMIAADRARLMGERDRLEVLAVTEAIARNKLAAARACTSECCHRVIYDGADPKLCGTGLVCQSFQRGGLFGTAKVCVAGPSSTPVR